MLTNVQGWLKSITDFGVALIGAVVVIEILFPAFPSNIIPNIGALIAEFSDAGLAGFIALLLFAVFWQRRSEPAAAPPSNY
jgi:hypothetical protein